MSSGSNVEGKIVYDDLREWLGYAERLGEVRNVDVPEFISRYRFFFHSCRYTSLGLAACEAMMIGMPVVATATTELATVIRSGVNGYADTNRKALAEAMEALIHDRDLALRWGAAARETALRRFSIDRFVREWSAVLAGVTSTPHGPAA